MRKAFLCLLVLLFLLPTVSFSESAAAQPDSARAYADELQERFGITILIGDECVQRPEEDMFTVGYGFAMTPLLSMIKRADTVNELKKIEQALVRYPVSFFQYLRDESHPDGVRIQLADRLISSNPALHSSAYTCSASTWYDIYLEYGLFRVLSVHHELWHAWEDRILSEDPSAFAAWNDLNPEGFTYLNDYYADYSQYNPDYFIQGYSTVYEAEDRALLVEAFFDHPYEMLKEPSGILSKYLYLNEIVSSLTNYRYDMRTGNLKEE